MAWNDGRIKEYRRISQLLFTQPCEGVDGKRRGLSKAKPIALPPCETRGSALCALPTLRFRLRQRWSW